MAGGFQAHIDLLRFFLAHRDVAVEKIQGVLNAQRKPAEYVRDAPLLSRLFEDCFFTYKKFIKVSISIAQPAFCSQFFV